MTKKTTLEVLDDISDRMDRDAPAAVRAQMRGWGLEAARLFAMDEGFRQRRLLSLGLSHIDRDDHAAIAEAMRGPIHGDYLKSKNKHTWHSTWSPHSRWVLCGFRLAALRMARAKTRRRSLKIVKD